MTKKLLTKDFGKNRIVGLKIPKTTDAKPYVEFKVDKKGRIKLAASSNWWGGISARFVSSDGTEGNTCKPKDLERYLRAFRDKKIKRLEHEIAAKEKELDKIRAWGYKVEENIKTISDGKNGD